METLTNNSTQTMVDKIETLSSTICHNESYMADATASLEAAKLAVLDLKHEIEVCEIEITNLAINLPDYATLKNEGARKQFIDSYLLKKASETNIYSEKLSLVPQTNLAVTKITTDIAKMKADISHNKRLIDLYMVMLAK